MKQLLALLLGRFCAWVPKPSTRNTRLSLVEVSNDLFDTARRTALKRPSVLKTRRQKLLARLIARELERHHASLMKDEQTNLSGTGAMLSDFYLRSGYLYFADFGISSESEFYFLELGRITPTLYREIKAVPKYLSHMLHEGDDRKEELQRKKYDELFNKHIWNPTFGSLTASLP